MNLVKNPGAFKAMPIFTGGVDGLMIHVATWKEPKRLSNPIYRLPISKASYIVD